MLAAPMISDDLPQPSLAKHISMVSAEDDNSVVIETAPFQDVKQLANAIIDVADSAIVCAPRPLDLLIAEILIPEVANLE